MLIAARIISTVANFYVIVVLIYVLLSWFPHDSGFMADIYNVLGTVCEPLLTPFRKLIPPLGGIDFSPIVAIVVLQLVVQLIVRMMV